MPDHLTLTLPAEPLRQALVHGLVTHTGRFQEAPLAAIVREAIASTPALRATVEAVLAETLANDDFRAKLRAAIEVAVISAASKEAERLGRNAARRKAQQMELRP